MTCGLYLKYKNFVLDSERLFLPTVPSPPAHCSSYPSLASRPWSCSRSEGYQHGNVSRSSHLSVRPNMNPMIVLRSGVWYGWMMFVCHIYLIGTSAIHLRALLSHVHSGREPGGRQVLTPQGLFVIRWTHVFECWSIALVRLLASSSCASLA